MRMASVVVLIDKAAAERTSDLFSKRFRELPSDPHFNRVMTEAEAHVGTAIATIVNLMNPHYVVVDSPRG